MANDWTTAPYVLDTVENKTIIALIHFLEWFPAAADDDLVIKDSYGGILFQRRAAAGAPNNESAGVEKSEILNKWVQGINLETIDGGTVHVHVK